MNDMRGDKLADYYRAADSWSDERAALAARSQRVTLFAAAALGVIAVLEGIALAVLLPLKEVVPYTLMVDRQTGYVQALKPLERQTIAPDAALVRSFLAQYVIGREGFDIDALNDTYRKVALWSAGDARSQYVAAMQAANPASPLASLPRRTVIDVQVRSISSLSPDTAQVRFATIRTDPGGQSAETGIWVAVIKYRFSGADMSAADRLINPLGFQVLRYDRSAELAPPEAPARAVPAAVPTAAVTPTATRAAAAPAAQPSSRP